MSKPDKKRPDSSQYRHSQIRAALEAMSHHKCFYCERKMSNEEKTVDHRVPVAEDPSKSFEWTNLYLACKPCQGQTTSIQLCNCIDPCGPVDPTDHLDFVDEVIRPRDGSALGRATIQRYGLDADSYNYLRSKALMKLMKRLLRGELADSALTQPESAYSLMFRRYLDSPTTEISNNTGG